jgi:hypothetical protein
MVAKKKEALQHFQGGGVPHRRLSEQQQLYQAEYESCQAAAASAAYGAKGGLETIGFRG